MECANGLRINPLPCLATYDHLVQQLIYPCRALGCTTFAFLLDPLIPGMTSVTFTNVICLCFSPFAISSSRSPVLMPMTVHISPLLSLSLLSTTMSCLLSVTACIHSSRSWLHKSAGATNVHVHCFFLTTPVMTFSSHLATTGGFITWHPSMRSIRSAL
jgi:uncharacterized membrane protein YozB (DUF420 family)